MKKEWQKLVKQNNKILRYFLVLLSVLVLSFKFFDDFIKNIIKATV